jgi:hypothetical protein
VIVRGRFARKPDYPTLYGVNKYTPHGFSWLFSKDSFYIHM